MAKPAQPIKHWRSWLFTALVLCATSSRAAELWINEVLFNPPSTDIPNEYIELRGMPNLILTNGTYFVLTSTNVAAPLANWTPMLTNQFNGGGNFSFTNVIDPAVVSRFYLLQVP